MIADEKKPRAKLPNEPVADAASATIASSRSNLELIVGAFFVLLAVMGIMSKSLYLVLMCIGFLFMGVVFIARGAQWRMIDALTKKYFVLIGNQEEVSIHDLAASMGTAPGTVKDHFALFAKRGLLTDVVIDEQSNKIVIAANRSAVEGAKSQAIHLQETIEVECQGCGARKMMRRGEKTICDHCGSELGS